MQTDRSGAEYVTVGEGTSTGEAPAGAWREPLADADKLHRVLTEWQRRAGLSVTHRAALAVRGMTGELVERLEYATLSEDLDGRRGSAQGVQTALGIKHLTDVPGFYRRGLARTVSVAGAPGLTIPVRDAQGRIQALRIRVDEPGEGGKYRWHAAPQDEDIDGCGPKALAHVPLHDAALLTGIYRLTEGELKADLATHFSGVLTVSVPGVGQWSLALPALRGLGAQRVLLAWDADARSNPGVAGALQRCAVALAAEGYELALEVWPPECGKGIDDVLAAGKSDAVEVHDGEEVWTRIAAIAASAGAKADPGVEARAVVERLKPILAAAPEPSLVAFGAEMLDAAAALLVAKARPEFEALLACVRRAKVSTTRWRSAVEERVATRERKSTARAESADWLSQLALDQWHRVDATLPNCVTALVHAPAWQGVLAFDEFANCLATLKPPPWHADDLPAGGARAGTWTDEDDGRLACWLAREAGIKASPGMALTAAAMVARRTSFHPVREYLERVTWDGIARLGAWLRTYAGAVEQSDAYLERVGMWFLISAVARIFDPGCQVHHVLILEGKQGRKKSTAVRSLVPREEWFAEHNAALGDKDAIAILRGRWIIELSELDSLTRAEVGAVKKYMTTATDSYRPHYGRHVVRVPRHCVFMGTVNEDDYLRDATGNRRFWPVAVEEIDAEALARDLDQLWAEAVVLYREGCRWWPEKDDLPLLEAEQEKRYRQHPWEPLIAEWIEHSREAQQSELPPQERAPWVTAAEVLERVVRKPRERWTDQDTAAIGKILARLGWTRGQSRRAGDGVRGSDGKRKPRWVFYPPGHDHGQQQAPSLTSVSEESL